MCRNSRNDLPNVTFVLTISIFWEAYLEPTRISMMEVLGKELYVDYYFRNKAS